MNIELRFLQKAIQDKNYISFTYKNKKYSKIKPFKLVGDEILILKTEFLDFQFELITKLKIFKEKY